MAEEECGESSVVAMSSSSNWWDNVHGGAPSWAWQNHGRNPSSGSPTCQDDVSISNSYNTNSSIHSGLTVESSHRLLDRAASELMLGEHMSDNQLWSHMLLGMANNGENYVDSSSSSKSMSSYFAGSGGDHHHNDGLITPPLRSNLVKDWSIAPPISEVNYLSLDSSSGLFPRDACHKQYGDIEAECELGYGGFQDNSSRYCYGRSEDDPLFVDGSVSHMGTLGQHHRVLNKPGRKSSSPLSYHGCKKQGTIPPLPASSSSSSVRTNSVKRQASTNDESKKKKTSEDSPESTSVAKKHKHDSSSTTAARMQVTKAKLGDRITTLQQIVSPFGKTDTASVLSETVGYIKFLQEQVRLLVRNPYMKANPHKDLWGGIERKERVELRSKGLCLAPVSCTPQVYRDNTGSDYWTPPYRSMLYR